MELTNKDKKIAKAIISAQIASDAGKGIHELYSGFEFEKPNEKGYTVKEQYINKAIKMIATSKNSIFRFKKVEAPDQNGNHSMITYFDFKLDGISYQVSFHSFSGLNGNNHGNWRTKWDKEVGGSRNACALLMEFI